MILKYLSSIVLIAKDLRFHYFLVFFKSFHPMYFQPDQKAGKKVTWQILCYKINHGDVLVQKNEIIPSGAGTLVSLQDGHQLPQLFLKLCCQ